jgi:hypothetical protein
VEWRQGEDGNDDLSPASLLFFACQVPERTCKRKTNLVNLLKDEKHLHTENICFLSAQCISTVDNDIQNPPSKVNVTLSDLNQKY